MNELIIDVIKGVAIFIGSVVAWSIAKYLVERFREYAKTTETKADDKLADELAEIIDEHKPGEKNE